MDYIITNESEYKPTALGDMNIKCADGSPVRARGLFQITECYHPEVTDEQAFNPVYAMNWAIPMIADKQTCTQQWTTCRNYYAN